jgi:hypothetical protein
MDYLPLLVTVPVAGIALWDRGQTNQAFWVTQVGQTATAQHKVSEGNVWQELSVRMVRPRRQIVLEDIIVKLMNCLR